MKLIRDIFIQHVCFDTFTENNMLMTHRSIMTGMAMLFCIAMLSVGCKKNCSSVACHSYGYNTSLGYSISQSEVCTNGSCFCPNGLEGDSCHTFSINKFIQPTNTWQVSDGCSGYGSTYTVYLITSTSNYNLFYINGLFGGGAQIEADIISNGSHQGVNLNIPPQTTPSGTINSGSGIYQTNGGIYGKIILTLDYTSNSTGIESNCTLTLSQY